MEDLSSRFQESHINTWVRPLYAIEREDTLQLLAPNPYVLKWVTDNCYSHIKQTLPNHISVELSVGSVRVEPAQKPVLSQKVMRKSQPLKHNNLNLNYTFDSFVEGKTNQLAYAAAKQVAQSPKHNSCNPLFIYGGVGLGKTHLVHAVGNAVLKQHPEMKVLYLHSETFVTEMVAAISHGTMSSFKKKYRSIDLLLVDDIQLFVGKKQSQEEFFHTFNTLFENGQQLVLTSDRYPKNIVGLPERLVSRFVHGLAQAIEPPEYETRVAILSKKAEREGVVLPENVLTFIAKQIHSNVRELEGAMRSVVTHARFSNTPISLSLSKEVLKDLISANRKLVSIENIQKKTCEYFHLRINDLISAKRSRSIVRPRQIAMALTRELTDHSLPEIGEAFGGRDHTTVMNACWRIESLRKQDPQVEEDYQLLMRILTV